MSRPSASIELRWCVSVASWIPTASASARWFGRRAVFSEIRISSPKPSTRPHPPILIGGMGERRTLRLVARYADACNLFDIPDGGATITRKLAVLAEHCAAVGRRYEDIEKTVSTRLAPGESVASFVERCRALSALGIEHAAVITTGPWTDEGLATLAAAVTEVEAFRGSGSRV